VSTPDSNSEITPAKDSPARIRLALSQHQKQRSKLKQVVEQPMVAEPTPAPAPPVQPPTEPVRRVRLKRSGHMHEDLTAPLPPAPNRNEPDY
jgi:hypothetical protein